MIFSSSIFLLEIFIILFSSTCEQYSIVYMYIFIIHASAEECLRICSSRLLLSRAAVNVDEQASAAQDHQIDTLGTCQGVMEIAHKVDLFF